MNSDSMLNYGLVLFKLKVMLIKFATMYDTIYNNLRKIPQNLSTYNTKISLNIKSTT